MFWHGFSGGVGAFTIASRNGLGDTDKIIGECARSDTNMEAIVQSGSKTSTLRRREDFGLVRRTVAPPLLIDNGER